MDGVILEAEFQSLNGFRRTLGPAGRQAFDLLFAAVKFHQPAMVYASRATPLEAILMGILVEQQKAIADCSRPPTRLKRACSPRPAPLPSDRYQTRIRAPRRASDA